MPIENLTENINQDEQLDISIERVKKINSPLLVIGLGGTGSDIVQTVKRTFAERYELPKDRDGRFIPVPEKTAYLAIDTAAAAQGALNGDEFVNITLPGLQAILDPKQREFSLTPYERKWVNKNLDSAASGVGASTYRQAARFMLFRNYARVESAIQNALVKIVRTIRGAETANGRTEIVIATGISGGTGSGLFLDIAQIVRNIMKTSTELNTVQYHITGYIVMPDISISNTRNAEALRKILEHNGYAALKELDFWMRVGEHKTPYVAQFNENTKIAWTLPPFDACILMSGTTVGGAVYDNAYQVTQKTIAENLLHYLAEENVKVDENGTTAAYTYIQYEDNLKALVQSLDKRLPLFYGYRAIGAYTKRIPKKKVLYYEGSILFKEFIPLRDNNQRLVPADGLFHDGETIDRMKEIVKELKPMYDQFCNQVPLPDYCRTAANDKDRLNRMRNMNPEPHEYADAGKKPWRETVVRPAAHTSAQSYLAGAWDRFAVFARKIITDPELGPFSLKEYLQDGKGLYKALEEEVSAWKTKAGSFINAENIRLKDCQGEKWNYFLKPPMLGAKGAINAYLQALNDYYASVRQYIFMAEYADAVQMLFLRVKEFLRDSLDPLCKDLLRLEKIFKSHDVADKRLEDDIFDLETIKKNIEGAMDDDSKRDGIIVRGFLGDLCDACFTTVPSADAHSSGVSFTYQDKGMTQMREAVRKNLNNNLEAINDQSLDSIMEQQAGDDPAEQKRIMDALANSVLNSANPMFSQDARIAAERCATYSYLSVPSKAVKHLEHYHETLGNRNVEPKSSKIEDHMYCITAWDGLPLYRYSQMDKLEAAYESDLTDTAASMGLHLVWDGDHASDYTSNWTKLPPPRPYFFFASKGQPHVEKWYEDIRSLVRNAQKCGLVAVDTGSQSPSITVNLLQTDDRVALIKSSVMICRDVDAIQNEKDPKTGSKFQPEQVQTRVEQYLKNCVQEKLDASRKAECLAPFLGMQNAPCNPWDANISNNHTLMETAEKNHELLCYEMAAAIISMHPRLVSALEQQIEGWEYAFDIIRKIKSGSDIWIPRIQYADHAALYFVYGIIGPSMNGYRYVSGDEDVYVIQEPLLKEDIKNEKPLVKCAAHLGDLDENNQIRFELEKLLRENKEYITRSEQKKTLKKEEIEQLQKNARKLQADADKALGDYNSLLRKPNAEVQKIDSITKMLGRMAAMAKNMDETFTNAMENY